MLPRRGEVPTADDQVDATSTAEPVDLRMEQPAASVGDVAGPDPLGLRIHRFEQECKSLGVRGDIEAEEEVDVCQVARSSWRQAREKLLHRAPANVARRHQQLLRRGDERTK